MELLRHKYGTSKNYEKLWELAQTQRVVCFVSGDGKGKDVCMTQAYPYNDDSMMVSAGSEDYISAFLFGEVARKDAFLFECNQKNLEFIDPEPEYEVALENSIRALMGMRWRCMTYSLNS